MSYSITPSDDKKYIILKVVGNLSRQTALQYNLEAHALGGELGITRYLLDLTECRNTDTVMRNYTFVYTDMQHPGINKQAHIAMLISPGDHSHDFIEALFRNAGMDAALFHDRDLAILHLMRD